MTKKTRWTYPTPLASGSEEESPKAVEDFLDAVEAVCRAHGFSISHEDGHGAFVIEPFREGNIEWLRCASRVKERG